MKSVKLVEAYQDNDGIATLDFEVKMKTVHDPKGKFNIGFMLMGKKSPRLMIFDDDRNIIGMFEQKEIALRFLDNLIEKKMMRHRITYKYPVTSHGSGYLVGIPNVITVNKKIDDEHLKGFILSRDILEKGELPQEKTQKWRFK